MRRFRLFVTFQRAAWRALFRRRRKPLALPSEPNVPEHPSELCRCYGGQPSGTLGDHLPDCVWLAAMCKACSGTGWCSTCGGDGTQPQVPEAEVETRPGILKRWEESKTRW